MSLAQAEQFLGGSVVLDTSVARSVLLLAPFDHSAYEHSLFDTFGVPFPDHLARALDKRRADYLAGRALVKRAFDLLGLPPRPVATAADRAPIWPAGVIGSLSHSRSRCACLISTDTTLQIGVDVETHLSAKSAQAVHKVALSEAEQALVADHPEPVLLQTLAFCAKETLFKALYPQVQSFFGFDAAELCGPPSDTRIQLCLTRRLHGDLPCGAVFDIRYQRLGDQTLTWLIARDGVSLIPE